MQAKARLMLAALVLLTVFHPFAHHDSTRLGGMEHVRDHGASLRECPCVHTAADVAAPPLQSAGPTAVDGTLASLPALAPLEIAQGCVPARAPPAA